MTATPSGRSWLYKTMQVLARFFTTQLFQLQVCGLENVPRTGGALLLANHQSYLDPVLVGTRLRRPITFMADSDLFKNKYFGWLIRNLHAFPVRQGKGDVGAIKQSIQLLHDGHMLNIYPEGSRSTDGEIAPIQSGIALILRRADVPIIPVLIDGAYKAWPRHRKLFQAFPVRLWYGKPLEIDGLDSKAIVALLDRTLREMQREVRTRGLPCLTRRSAS